MSLLAPIRHVARLTLEAFTPISIGSGEGDPDLDTPLFRDWNGLPCLSGPGVIGVLKSLHRECHPGATDGLFGFEQAGGRDGVASRLLVSFGLVHDQNGQAHRELLSPQVISADPVLELLSRPAPILRDSVAIGPNGAAAEHAKFDRAAVPRGARFSLDLSLDGELEGSDGDRQTLLSVVALFASPHVRFGGATRRGLGRLSIVEELSRIASIDRRRVDGRNRWVAFRMARPDLAPDACGFEKLGDLEAPSSSRHPVSCELRLSATGFWRAGQGNKLWTDATQADTGKVSRSPLSEPVIQWNGTRAQVLDAPRPTVAPLPGAGVKGALAHRAEYHLRRMEGVWGGDRIDSRLLDSLLGSVSDKDEGQAGVLFVDDAWVEFPEGSNDPHAMRRTRNSLDRHTGGSRNGKLFNDEALWRGPEIVVPITVLASVPAKDDGLRAKALRALDWAIEDLCEGRLALGAGDAIGDGVFTGALPQWTGGAATLVEAAALAAGKSGQ